MISPQLGSEQNWGLINISQLDKFQNIRWFLSENLFRKNYLKHQIRTALMEKGNKSKIQTKKCISTGGKKVV